MLVTNLLQKICQKTFSVIVKDQEDALMEGECNVLLALNNHVTSMMIQDVYVKEIGGRVHECKGSDIVQTYKRLCQEGMRPECVITDDQTIEYARQLKEFDDNRNYIWVINYGVSNNVIINGLRNGVIDFLRWPARLEDMTKIMRTYGVKKQQLYVGMMDGQNIVNAYIPIDVINPVDPDSPTIPQRILDNGVLTEEELEEFLEIIDYDVPLFGGLLATGDDTPIYPSIFLGIGLIILLILIILEKRKI